MKKILLLLTLFMPSTYCMELRFFDHDKLNFLYEMSNQEPNGLSEEGQRELAKHKNEFLDTLSGLRRIFTRAEPCSKDLIDTFGKDAVNGARVYTLLQDLFHNIENNSTECSHFGRLKHEPFLYFCGTTALEHAFNHNNHHAITHLLENDARLLKSKGFRSTYALIEKCHAQATTSSQTECLHALENSLFKFFEYAVLDQKWSKVYALINFPENIQIYQKAKA